MVAIRRIRPHPASLLLLLIWWFAVSQCQGAQYEYFDQIRTDASAEVQFDPRGNSTSNVAKVQLQNETFRLVNLATFLPFRHGERTTAIAEAAATLLAVRHFNNKELSPVLLAERPELRDCNVRLTTEFLDTNIDVIVSTAQLSELLEGRPRNDLASPRPSVVVGAFYSAISSPMAILADIQDVAQISPASTSANLDDVEVYPYFARTCPSSDGEASAIVDYYVNMGVSRVVIMYLSDAFGAALQRNFEEQAMSRGMETIYTGYVGEEDIPAAIQRIKESKYQHIFVVTFSHYEEILEEAYNAGLANGNHAWLFYGPNQFEIQDDAVYRRGSPLHEASKGAAIINFGSSPQTLIQYPGRRRQDPLPSTLTTANERFRFLWSQKYDDPDFLAYLDQKLPTRNASAESLKDSSGVYHDLLSAWAFFLYDAVTAIGIAMCRTETEFFSGPHLINEFKHIDFEGVSGRVRFDDVNTRQHTTVLFTVWNMIPAEDEQNDLEDVRFLLSPTAFYSAGQWEEIRPFVFADGGTVPPEDLTPVNMNVDTVDDPLRYTGFGLSVTIVVFVVYCLVWTHHLRQEAVVCSSQISFLVLMAAGSVIQALAIIPLSLNHPDSTTLGDDNRSYERACMTVPWLYYMGLSLTTAALYAKTSGTFEILRIPDLDRLLVESRDFAFWCCLVIGVNAIILTLWTTLGPLRYEVVEDGSVDIFGRSLSSYGMCRSQEGNNTPNWFAFALLLANCFGLFVANFLSYRTRYVETEYQESQYIAFALGTITEALVIGSAMRYATWEEPDANYVITIGSIFLTSFVTAALVFVPKMLAFRAERRELAGLIRRQSMRSRHSHDFGDSCDVSDASSEDVSHRSDDFGAGGDVSSDARSNVASSHDAASVGAKIIHHPALNEGRRSPYVSRRGSHTQRGTHSSRHLRASEVGRSRGSRGSFRQRYASEGDYRGQQQANPRAAARTAARN